jgi:hypothetical protein
MNRRIWVAAGLKAFVLAAVPLLLPASAQSAFRGGNGKIAFTRSLDIWTTPPDGTAQTNLTNSDDVDGAASWSPDGTKIAFASSLGGDEDPWQLYIMNADGSGKMWRGPLFSAGFGPAWSPDGTEIAFASSSTIQVMNAYGTVAIRALTNGTNPAWSPDGSKIAFETFGSNVEVHVINANGTGEVNLSNRAGFDGEPNWSPDGTKIAYTRGATGPCNPCKQIYLMNANGTGQTPLTGGANDHSQPAWSPDGTKVAFTTSTTEPVPLSGISTINANGTGGETPVTPPSTDSEPDWQPLPGSSPLPPYPTPKFASPLKTALVPLFIQCGTPANPTNASHATPLAVGSCDPPKRSSEAHFGAQAAGFAQLAVIYGDTNPANGDQADVTVRSSLSDVQTAAGADYDPNPGGADATLATRLRFTDRANGASGTDPGTAGEFDFLVPVDCTATAASVGSTCALDTTADAVTAGIIKENKATVIQTFRFRLNDSGANGIRGDGDDKQFAMQGVFVP